MAAYEMWVHGNSAQIETPGDFGSVERLATALRIKGKPGTAPSGFGSWIHFAIPTPVIADGQKMKLQSVMLVSKGGQGAVVQQVQVYDGEAKIWGAGVPENSPGLVGSWKRDAGNLSPLNSGIDLAVYVWFVAGSSGAQIELIAAGCAFTPESFVKGKRRNIP